MPTIAVFGAGKSATVLIDFLKEQAVKHEFSVIVVDSNKQVAEAKVGNHPRAKAIGLDIHQDSERLAIVQQSDIVISLLPPAFHILLAKDCLQAEKHFLNASYTDEEIKTYANDIKRKGLLFLYEMGLDPGIDHMSAMEIIDRIKQDAGTIDEFYSHCGGLVAPESDDNCWHYKISWNPKNVVLAGKAGATFLQNGQVVSWDYHEVFAHQRTITLPNLGQLGYYPNRNSLSYIPLYGLEQANTFIRTTLRYPSFIQGWQTLINLGLTDETELYDTNQMTVSQFFIHHCIKQNKVAFFEQYFQETEQLKAYINLLQQLPDNELVTPLPDYPGHEVQVNSVTKEDAYKKAINHLQQKNNLFQQIQFLGLLDDTTPINKGMLTAAETLQWIIERKWKLHPSDKDMIVMQHQIQYRLHNKPYKLVSSLLVKGENSTHTAMAKTVSLPLGIAAVLLLQNKLPVTGLQIPLMASIYQPVLHELKQYGIAFEEVITPL